jgi:hypothetical protein
MVGRERDGRDGLGAWEPWGMAMALPIACNGGVGALRFPFGWRWGQFRVS